MTDGFAVSFSLSCTRASAEFLCAEVGLRIESAPRGMTQPALAGLGVTLARLAGLFGMLITSRGPETLHVLSTPYELLGDKRVSSAELMVQAAEIRGPETRVKCPMWSVMEPGSAPKSMQKWCIRVCRPKISRLRRA